ncbi:hypothetical protein [Fluviibacterium sp. S390]|uniref:hypothetical protein n=1 Tax=Fluviibacterium sp. S390 TaxID=3415139 RepID=UPI003C7E33FE
MHGYVYRRSTVCRAGLCALLALPGAQTGATTVGAFAFSGPVIGPVNITVNIPGAGGAQVQKLNVQDRKKFERDTRVVYSWDLHVDANGKKKNNTNSLDSRKLTRLFRGELDVKGKLFNRRAKVTHMKVTSDLVAEFQFTGSATAQRDPNGNGLNYDIKTKAKVSLKGDIDPPNQPPNVVYGSYWGTAKIEDPFVASQADLAASSADPDDFNYFMLFGLEEFDFQHNSDREFKVFYRNGQFERVIFSLGRTTGGGVSYSYDPNTAFYTLPDIDAVPDLTTTPQIDMNAFGASLLADLSADNMLSNPFYLGGLVTGLSTASDPNAGAAFGYSGFEGERETEYGLAPVPVPPAAMLGASALVLLGSLRRTRRKSVTGPA